MKSMQKVLLKLIPENLRLHLIRKNVVVPTGLPNVVIKLANTQDELEQAYRLLHNAYVKQNLMDPHPSGLRFNIWSALPYTSVIIAKCGEKIIGTVSLIIDSQIGLPSDKIYKKEIDSQRNNGKRIVEVSAFAVDPDFRQDGHKISLYLMKYLYQYSCKTLKADFLCASIREGVSDFYKALFAFEKKGKTINYDLVNGTPAVHISLDLSKKNRDKLKNIYAHYPDKNNLHLFCTSEEKEISFELPHGNSIFLGNPLMTPELLNYFLVQKTALHKDLVPRELELIKSAYESYFGKDVHLPGFTNNENSQRSGFRHLTKIHAAFVSTEATVFGTLYDISSKGAFFAPSNDVKLNEGGSLIFMLGDRKLNIKFNIAWENKGEIKRYPSGFGLHFASLIDLALVEPQLKIQKFA